jgi:hypothetical protein
MKREGLQVGRKILARFFCAMKRYQVILYNVWKGLMLVDVFDEGSKCEKY